MGVQAAISADVVRNLQEKSTFLGDEGLAHRVWLARYAAVVEAVLAEGQLS